MFRFLQIKNFQSHRDTRIDFDPGVNIFFGLSQAGKSALRKGLQLLTDNRPGGARFYSNFAPDKGKTIIELGIEGQDIISIEKSVKRKSDKTKTVEETKYQLNGEEFSGVSKEVPDQIKEFLNLTELNMQGQFDSPFLVTSSAGEIARTINRITKLENVDGWISALTKRINEAKNKTLLLEKQSQEIEIELGRYAGFEDLQSEIDDLQKASIDLKNCHRQKLSLDGQLVKIEDIDKKIQAIRPALSIQEDIDQIRSLESQITAIERRKTLTQRLRAIDEQVGQLKSVVGDLQELKGIFDIEQRQILLGRAVGQIERFDELTNQRDQLLTDMASLKEIKVVEERADKLHAALDKIKQIAKFVDDAESIYDEFKQKKITILRRDGRCPLCLSDIDEKMVKKLEKML